MCRRLTALLAIVTTCLGVGVSTRAAAIDFTKDELKTLAEGGVVRKPLPNSRQNGFYGGAGFAVIDAPVEAIWKALADWDAYPEIFPRTVAAKELSRKSDRSLVKIILGYKILSVRYHISVHRDWDKKTITFNLADNRAHDINQSKGYWKLMPQPDGRTLVAYAVAVQVPPGIVSFLGDEMEKSLERNVIGLPRYMKKYIEGDKGRQYGRRTAKAR